MRLQRVDEVRRFLRQALPSFLANLLLILLVSLNTYLVARSRLVPAVLVQIGISSAWVLNVRSVTSGTWASRIGYVVGGVTGQGLGVLLARWIG